MKPPYPQFGNPRRGKKEEGGVEQEPESLGGGGRNGNGIFSVPAVSALEGGIVLRRSGKRRDFRERTSRRASLPPSKRKEGASDDAPEKAGNLITTLSGFGAGGLRFFHVAAGGEEKTSRE